MLLYEGFPMKSLRMKRFVSPNGEVHYILEESWFLERTKKLEYFDISKIKETTKQEASKLLFLIRDE
jgi:hypothetical protein